MKLTRKKTVGHLKGE